MKTGLLSVCFSYRAGKVLRYHSLDFFKLTKHLLGWKTIDGGRNTAKNNTSLCRYMNVPDLRKLKTFRFFEVSLFCV